MEIKAFMHLQPIKATQLTILEQNIKEANVKRQNLNISVSQLIIEMLITAAEHS